jgi:hypothetical protein
MTTNFNLNKNFNPFVNKIINKVIAPSAQDFFGSILTKTVPNKRIPLIPSIYFNNNDSIGSQIINKYYTIKITLEKLETIKKFIIFLLESSKYDLESIKVSRLEYKLVSDNLIMKKESEIDKILEEFSDPKSKTRVTAISNNTFSMLKGSDQTLFYPKIIFQSEYNKDPESKTYFVKLIDKYDAIPTPVLNTFWKNSFDSIVNGNQNGNQNGDQKAYESIHMKYKEQIVQEMDNKYGILGKRGIKKIF